MNGAAVFDNMVDLMLMNKWASLGLSKERYDKMYKAVAEETAMGFESADERYEVLSGIADEFNTSYDLVFSLYKELS